MASGLLALLSVLTYVRAPDTTLGWKVALVVTEFGHWLAVLSIAAAGLAMGLVPGAARWVIVGLCVVSLAGLLRPAIGASKLARGFSWARLYRSPASPLVPVRTETYARHAGEELRLDLYQPPTVNGSDRGRPCLLVVHGGGWDSGDNTQLTRWNHRWASRGWAVAAINYRLAPAHPWPAAGDDVRAAVAWLKTNASRYQIDASRLVILGRSAGGQIATAAAYGLRDPSIRGVIALYAPHDMKFAWGVSREDDALNSVKLMRQYFGGPPDTPGRVGLYESASGQLLAGSDSPPTLLIHGYPDRLVWHRHSRRLAARLAELGVSHTHIELPWATHAFDFNPDGPGGQVADAAIDDFLERAGR